MTQNQRELWAATLALAALCAAACQKDLVKAPASGRVDMLRLEDYPQIAVQPGLQEALAFSPADVELSTAERPMQVTVPVRSIHDKYALNIQYRFEFLDGRNISLRTNSGWRFAHLAPRILTELKGSALDTSAADWRLVVRAAR